MLCLFLTVLLAGLQCVILAVPGHTHLLFKLTFSLSIVIFMSSKRIPDYESDTEMNR